MSLISVIMGVRYLRPDLTMLNRAVGSILEQTCQNFELLICEYGSTQEAKEFLSKIASDDKRVKLITGTAPGTLAQNLNKCLACAKGEYIARMDDDDYSAPNRLEEQLCWLTSHKNCSFVGCCVELERDGDGVGVRKLPEYPKIEDFLFVQPFIHPALLFRREAMENVGGYSEEPQCVGCEDYDLLLRLYEKGCHGANIQMPLFRYTLPPVGESHRNMKLRANEVKVRYTHFKRLGLLPKRMPYVIKPVIVGLIPPALLEALKSRRQSHA